MTTIWYLDDTRSVVANAHVASEPGLSAVTRIHARTNDARTAHAPMGRMRSAAVACGGDRSNPVAGTKWQSTMQWYYVSGSVPSNVNRDAALQAIRDARVEWEANQNWCSLPDESTVNFTYRGTRQTDFKENGRSTVGFQKGSTVARTCDRERARNPTLACTVIYRDPHPDGTYTIYEADTMNNRDVSWSTTTSTPPSSWDFQSNMAHETGAAIGFNVVRDDSTVVMYESQARGDQSRRKLGKGDANGNNTKYHF